LRADVVPDDERAGQGHAVATERDPEGAAGEDERSARLRGRRGSEDAAQRDGQQEATA
jgi:hypothetical protein